MTTTFKFCTKRNRKYLKKLIRIEVEVMNEQKYVRIKFIFGR